MKTLQYHQQSLLFVLFLLLCVAAGIRQYSRWAGGDSIASSREYAALP